MGEPGKSPIFVIGVARSGTTMLRYMLCSNPRIYVPPESNFIPRFFRNRPTEELTRERALDILDRISSYRTFWRDWREDPLDPRELIDGLERLTPASFIDALYGRYASQYGAERWGDKSTIYPAWIELFVEMFPSCKIVHVIRDARDVTASSLDAYRGARFFYMDSYYAARMWRERLRSGLAAGRRLPPERYHEIRYEDLTADPEGRIRELCGFLEEEFHPAMMAPNKEALKHYHSFGIHQRVRGEVTTARSGRWRRDLAPADQRLVQRIAGGLLSELGYPLEDLGRQSLPERVRTASLRTKFEGMDRARRVLGAFGILNPALLLRGLPRRRLPGTTRPTPAPAGSVPLGSRAPTDRSSEGISSR